MLELTAQFGKFGIGGCGVVAEVVMWVNFEDVRMTQQCERATFAGLSIKNRSLLSAFVAEL